MRYKRSTLWMCAISPLLAMGCDRAAEQVTAPRDASGLARHELSIAAAAVNVANVDELYAAVNDAANEGADILLSPGSYVLSATDGAGAARPNGGRLEVQLDMSLYGLTGDRAAVVIDASTLPASAFNAPFGRTGVIRIGRGTNSVEWLTIVGNPAAAAGIATELTGTPTTKVRVAHVLATGSSRGVDIRNVGATMIGRKIEAEVTNSEFVGPTEIVGMTEGIRVANFVGANNGVIVANLSGNRAHGYILGCIIANNRSSNAAIAVTSSGERYYGNTLGCEVDGGLSQTTGVAMSNLVTYEAHGTHYSDNTAGIPGIGPGGLKVHAAVATVAANIVSNNTVRVDLWGVKISGNEAIDFEGFGAWKESAPGIAGTNNHAIITLHGVSKKLEVETHASFPSDPGGTNTITVIR